MIKRRSNKSFFSVSGVFVIFSLVLVAPGCNKKSPPPPPPKATPLPKKVEQPPAATLTKPILGAPSTARKSLPKDGVQRQDSTSKRLLPAGAVSLDFTSRRDPFKPYAQMPANQQATVGKSSKGRTHDPLPIQSFDTEKFRVSGIITGLKENSAIVVDPNGKGYVVREGMLIGNNDGVVKKITTSAVEVEESFRDDNGRIRKRLVKLTLIRKK